MPIHEQTVYPNRNKFTIPNVCKTVNTTKAANAIIIAFASVMVLSFFILSLIPQHYNLTLFISS